MVYSTTLHLQELTTRIAQWAEPILPLAPQLLGSTPISNLPPELLSEIFLLSLPEERFPSPSPATAPLSLIHVCSLWRRLAASLPALWCQLHLNYRTPADIAPFHRWLSRSGDSRPLSLSLSVDFDESPRQDIIDAFMVYSSRWKHIHLEFTHLQCAEMYNLTSALGKVPMLERFEFHVRDISTANIVPVTTLLYTAPNLKELVWVDDLADADTLLSLPLPRLSRLSLSMNYGSLDYLKFLRKCENLEHIRIVRPVPELERGPPSSPLVLNKLTGLNIAHDLTGILDHLVLPSLKRVRVHMDSVPDIRSFRPLSRTSAEWDPTSLLNLLERSGCSLTSLKIYPPMSQADSLKCFEACPSLKSLTLSGPTLSEAVIHALTPRALLSPGDSVACEDKPEEWDCLCPLLEEMCIEGVVPTGCSLADMVQSRVGVDVSISGDRTESSCLVPRSFATDSFRNTSNPVHTVGHHSPKFTPRIRRLKVEYPAGHRDVAPLRALAAAAATRANPRVGSDGLKDVDNDPGTFELCLTERIRPPVAARGSSAGRIPRTLQRVVRGRPSASR